MLSRLPFTIGRVHLRSVHCKSYCEGEKIKVGSGSDENSQMGPIVSEAHMNKILSYIQIGKEEGAKLIVGGNRIKEEGMDKGYFVEPTIFVDTTPDMRIVQEEILDRCLSFKSSRMKRKLFDLPMIRNMV